MKNLKLYLITILSLAALCVTAELYAEPPNREEIRMREASAQMPEAVQEAQRDYEARIKAYEEMVPKDRIALEDYLKNRASALESTTSVASRTAVAATPIVAGGGTTTPPSGGGTTPPIDAVPAVGNTPVIQPPPIITPPPPAAPAPKRGGRQGVE